MTVTCEVLMRRVPELDGRPQERSAHLQRCGRTVAADGLCAFHLRQLAIPADDVARWRRALRAIRRG